MSKRTTPNVTIGMDWGDRFSHVVVLDAEGEVVEETRIPTTEPAMRRWFSRIGPVRVALEVGTHSRWVSRLLEELGHEVIVANARKVRLIYGGDHRTDRLDADALARLARLDPALLHGIEHRGEQAHQDLAVIRAREVVVRTRTRIINHVRGAVKSGGSRPPRSSAASFHHKAAEAIPEGLRLALQPLLDQLEQITRQIRDYDRQIGTLSAERYPGTRLLTQVPGVGPITALTFLLTLEDPNRFNNSRAVGTYLGLCPRTDQSGDNDPQCRITKAGNPHAQKASGPGGPLPVGSLRTGHGSQALGTGAGGTRWQDRQEESRHCGGPETGRPSAPPLGNGRSLRAPAHHDHDPESCLRGRTAISNRRGPTPRPVWVTAIAPLGRRRR
jgi:transposase